MSFLSSVLSSFSQFFFFVSYPVTKSSFCSVQVIIFFKENFLTPLFSKHTRLGNLLNIATNYKHTNTCAVLSVERPTADWRHLWVSRDRVPVCPCAVLCACVWFCVAPRVPETPAAAFATPGCSSVAPILWCAGKDPLLPLIIRSLNFFREVHEKMRHQEPIERVSVRARMRLTIRSLKVESPSTTAEEIVGQVEETKFKNVCFLLRRFVSDKPWKFAYWIIF